MPIPALAAIKGFFTGKGTEIVKDVMGGLDSLFTSKEEKMKKEIELTEKINAHLEKMEGEITQRMLSEDKAVTDRWQADMSSDSWLSKNTRPIVMLSLLGFIFILVFFDSAIKEKFEVKEEYISLLKAALETSLIAYFGSRGFEKYTAMKTKK